MSQQTLVSLAWSAVGAVCLAGFLANNTTVLSTAASAMGVIFNGGPNGH